MQTKIPFSAPTEPARQQSQIPVRTLSSVQPPVASRSQRLAVFRPSFVISIKCSAKTLLGAVSLLSLSENFTYKTGTKLNRCDKLNKHEVTSPACGLNKQVKVFFDKEYFKMIYFKSL